MPPGRDRHRRAGRRLPGGLRGQDPQDAGLRLPGRGGHRAQGGAPAAAGGVLAGRARPGGAGRPRRRHRRAAPAAGSGPDRAPRGGGGVSLGRTRAVALEGIEGSLVDVEADVAQGLPQFTVSGLPDTACRQSPDRIKAAAANSGVPIPNRRLTVNLSPASLPKAGSGFDLPIAIAVLAAAGLVPAEVVAPMVHIGELGLDGSVRPVRGVLPAVLAAARLGVEAVVVPADNAAEAALVPGMTVLPARSLAALVGRYRLLGAGGVPEDDPVVAAVPDPDAGAVPDLRDVVGQDEARLALEIAAAGGHHLLMGGPPGAGKTMLA